MQIEFHRFGTFFTAEAEIGDDGIDFESIDANGTPCDWILTSTLADQIETEAEEAMTAANLKERADALQDGADDANDCRRDVVAYERTWSNAA